MAYNMVKFGIYVLNEGQKCSNLELKDDQFDELLLFSKYDFWPENGKFFFIKGAKSETSKSFALLVLNFFW